MYGVQLIWNNLSFGTSLKSFLPITDFKCSAGLKTPEKGLNVIGWDNQKVSFSVIVSKTLGSDPMGCFQMFDTLKGCTSPIYMSTGAHLTLTNDAFQSLFAAWSLKVNSESVVQLANSLLFGTRLGGVHYMLTGVKFTPEGFDSLGGILKAKIDLEFEEDGRLPPNSQLKVYIDGKEVDTAISDCKYDTYVENKADSLEIHFADKDKKWEKADPKTLKNVRISDGLIESGNMYIESLSVKDSKCTLKAFSVPRTAFDKKSRSFENLSLIKLAEKIASEHSLKFRNFGVSDIASSYIQQNNQSDVALLADQCKRASASFVVHDGVLNLYDEKTAEHRNAEVTLVMFPTDKGETHDKSKEAYGKIELDNSVIVVPQESPHYKTDNVLREKIVGHFQNESDMKTVALNLLRDRNKMIRTGELTRPLLRNISAGSVVKVLGLTWLGNAFVYHCRHDFIHKKSTIKFRKPLD